MDKFPCTNCGACCRSITGMDFLADFDIGNGVCQFLSEEDKHCEIYENRPLLCRIDESHEQLFSEYFSKEKFYQLNARACNELQEKLGISEVFRVMV